MAHLPMRLQPGHARSRRCQRTRAHRAPVEPQRSVPSAARAAHAACVPGRHARPAIPRRCLLSSPPAVGVPNRKPPRDVRSVLRGRRSLRGWTPRHTPGWLPAAHSAAYLTPLRCRSGCGPSFTVRVGAHRALDRPSANLAPPALRRPTGVGAPSGQPSAGWA